MDAESVPAIDRAGTLVLHRPHGLTAGACRRIQVYLDDQRIVDLEHGAMVSVTAEQGPHLLRARCFPLSSCDLPVILNAREILHMQIYVSVLDELEIEPDQHRGPPSP
jgi:hypothetical protein